MRLRSALSLITLVFAGPSWALKSDEQGFKDYRCVGRVLEHGESRLLFDLAVPLRHGQYAEFTGQRITVDFAGNVSSAIDDQRDKQLSPLGSLPPGVNYIVFAEPGPGFDKDSFVPRIRVRRTQPGEFPQSIGDVTGNTDAYVETSAGGTRVECIRTESPGIARARR